jgi:hypothetical protein
MDFPSQIASEIATIGAAALGLFADIIVELWPWLLGFGALFGLVFYIKGRVGSIGR